MQIFALVGDVVQRFLALLSLKWFWSTKVYMYLYLINCTLTIFYQKTEYYSELFTCCHHSWTTACEWGWIRWRRWNSCCTMWTLSSCCTGRICCCLKWCWSWAATCSSRLRWLSVRTFWAAFLIFWTTICMYSILININIPICNKI